MERLNMLTSQQMDFLPIWSVLLLTILLLYLAFWTGLRLGKYAQTHWAEQSTDLGLITGASLSFLALLLAFVINYTMGVFTDRRQLVVSEANAIGTAYLRAGLLPDPARTESRQLFGEYVAMRLEGVQKGKARTAIARSEEIQERLWSLAEELGRDNPTPIMSLYLSALNDVIDVHAERLSAEIDFRLPLPFLLGLLGVSFLTMVLVGITDSYHERRNRLALVVLVVILALALLLIVELDRSNTSLIRVSQKPLLDLQQSLLRSP
jgi:hypothetical protein